MIDCRATQRVYLDHLAPIWKALPDDVRGTLFAGREVEHARNLGLEPSPRPGDAGMVLVASAADLHRDGRPAVMLNHGAGQTYCLAPETRVLTGDLRWTPIGQVQAGDPLAAFEEERAPPRQWRGWKWTTATSTRRIPLPCYRLTFADDTTIVASAQHRWLRRTNQTYDWITTESMHDADTWPIRNTKVLKPFQPWTTDYSWGAGYLAAAFDGEGSLTQTVRDERQNRCMLTFTQRDNAMLAEVLRQLNERNFRFSVNRSRPDGVLYINVLGGVSEVFRFVGSIRPRRLLDGFVPLDNGQMRGQPVQLRSKEFIGEHEVVALSTGTGTLFAEGFASHNSGDPAAPQAATSASYTGGAGRDAVIANLCPGPADVQACRRAQPDVPAYSLGGVPRLDRHVGYRRGVHVAFAWHWHMPMVPEGTPAWGHYCDVLADVAGRYPTLGHGHPRMWRYYRAQYEKLGIEPIQHFDVLLERGVGLLACDNSSVMYEAAALGIPVLALNAPWYRRDVHHGLRFWSHVPGLECDRPQDLPDAIGEAFDDPPQARGYRARAVRHVYGGPMDGRSTGRAVEAIMDILS